MKIWNLKLKLHSNTAKVDSDYPLENFPEWNFMSRNQNHGQNPLPSCMEHFSEIYGTVLKGVQQAKGLKPIKLFFAHFVLWLYKDQGEK